MVPRSMRPSLNYFNHLIAGALPSNCFSLSVSICVCLYLPHLYGLMSLIGSSVTSWSCLPYYNLSFPLVSWKYISVLVQPRGLPVCVIVYSSSVRSFLSLDSSRQSTNTDDGTDEAYSSQVCCVRSCFVIATYLSAFLSSGQNL